MVATEYNYAEIAPKVEQALRRAFPHNAVIETEEGYLGRVRVKVITSKLNGLSEREKQDTLWEILQAELPGQTEAVSVILGYGTDEI